MTVYIAEILGRSIAAFSATDDGDATTHLANKAFLRDLIVLQNKGRPLWDGVSPIETRLASEDEVETWQLGIISETNSETDDDDVHPFVFLIPVVDPSSDRFEDDEDDDGDHDHD